jgi:hypothetical protein
MFAGDVIFVWRPRVVGAKTVMLWCLLATARR